MTQAFRSTRQFDRDLKVAGKRGKNLEKIWAVIDKLLKREPLEPRHRPIASLATGVPAGNVMWSQTGSWFGRRRTWSWC